MEFDCEATDVCNLKASYVDYDVDLAPAHDCMMKKVRNIDNMCDYNVPTGRQGSVSRGSFDVNPEI